MPVLRGGHESAGSLIEPVHRPEQEPRLIPIAPGQPVFERSARLTARTLAGQRRGLVNDENVFVLPHHGRFALLRHNRNVLAPGVLRHFQRNHIARMQNKIRMTRNAVHQHASGVFQAGQAAVADAHRTQREFSQALPFFFGSNRTGNRAHCGSVASSSFTRSFVA